MFLSKDSERRIERRKVQFSHFFVEFHLYKVDRKPCRRNASELPVSSAHGVAHPR